MRSRPQTPGQVRKAFLRVASDGFEPARGRGSALPHAVLGVRAGRSKNSAECTREAGNAVAVAHLAAVRVPQSGAVGIQAPAFRQPSGGGSFTVLVVENKSNRSRVLRKIARTTGSQNGPIDLLYAITRQDTCRASMRSISATYFGRLRLRPPPTSSTNCTPATPGAAQKFSKTRR
jgi:hypothetical protein